MDAQINGRKTGWILNEASCISRLETNTFENGCALTQWSVRLTKPLEHEEKVLSMSNNRKCSNWSLIAVMPLLDIDAKKASNRWKFEQKSKCCFMPRNPERLNEDAMWMFGAPFLSFNLYSRRALIVCHFYAATPGRILIIFNSKMLFMASAAVNNFHITSYELHVVWHESVKIAD